MAHSRQTLLGLIDKFLNDARLAAAETKSLGRAVAHICQLDAGDAHSAAVYLKERGFSGHAYRLTQDVERLRQEADEAFRVPFVGEPTPDDRKQERRCLGALHSKAHGLLQFLNGLKALVDEDDDDAVAAECQPAGEPVAGGGLHRKRFAELTNEAKELYAWIEPDFTTDPPQFMDDLNPDDFLAWRVKARNLLAQACGVESEHYKEFLAVEEGSYRRYFEMLDSLSAVFSAAREDYKGGYVQSARTLVQEDPAGSRPVGSLRADSGDIPEDMGTPAAGGEATPLASSPAVTRLITLLHTIRDGLDRSLDSLRQAPDGSELPDVQVNDDDVNTAVLYLRDVGLRYDGLRLHGAFARLRNRCMDEWFASMADGESQEYRDKLTELFGPFPSQGNPNDSVVADRRVAIVGWVVQLSEFVDELISSVTALSETQPDAADDNSQPPAPAHESQPPAVTPSEAGDRGKVWEDAADGNGVEAESRSGAQVNVSPKMEAAIEKAIRALPRGATQQQVAKEADCSERTVSRSKAWARRWQIWCSADAADVDPDALLDMKDFVVGKLDVLHPKTRERVVRLIESDDTLEQLTARLIQTAEALEREGKPLVTLDAVHVQDVIRQAAEDVASVRKKGGQPDNCPR